MDAVWVLLADGWWAVPAAVAAGGGGVLAWWGTRARRSGRVRRLELNAAHHDVRSARDALARARAAVHRRRADVARLTADRHAGRASAGDVADARHRLGQAQREVTAAHAQLVARRADVRAARATVPARRDGPEAMPLARLSATHDAINAEWVAYETDPHKAVAYPSMTDAREPLTVEFFRAQQRAQWLRPATGARVSPADYAAYREAVRGLASAFAAAEHDARRRAGERAPGEDRGERWAELARDVVGGAVRSAEAVRRAAEAWTRRSGRH